MTNGLKRHCADRETGFTLLELVIVLAVLTSAALIALPSADRTRRALPARTVAIDVAATLKTVRSAAMRSNRDQRFTIDLVNRTYWGDGLTKSHPLPRELSVSYDVPPSEQTQEGLAHVRFRPDGSSSGGRIRISGARQSASVNVDWLTGTARVEWRR